MSGKLIVDKAATSATALFTGHRWAYGGPESFCPFLIAGVKMNRRHIIISGTGRAGTTFLVQLLTELGLDTGFPHAHAQIHPNCNAGMELDIRDPNAPYIVKSPWLCDYLDDVLQGGEVVIDHAIIPMRDLHSAAQSRRDISSKAGLGIEPDNVPGGLWHTKEAADQEWILTGQLYKLIFTLAKYDIPIVLLLFPRLAIDPEYLYRNIRFALTGFDYNIFLKAFRSVSRPELIHDFSGPGERRLLN
jgi:hypothetical protein